MDWTFGIALLIGFAPVFILMDTILKNYTYPRVETPFFKDTTFFGLFTVGIVEGAVMAVVISLLGLLESSFSIMYMVMMAFVELMAIVVVMNLKRFRGKSDSIFYGYGMGLGMAGGMASGFVYLMLMASSEGLDPTMVVMAVILSFGISLIFSSGGTNIGEGIARHMPMQYLMQGAIPLVAFNMIFAILPTTGGIVYVGALLLMLLIGAYFFHKNLFVNLPNVVRDVLKYNNEKRDDIPKSR
ncbi:MAG: hypothetical protein IKP04_01995 [Candidatus Methanomethylophilaceae archaeon]|nr:hypothetical protein [Candidatus Methanomethylophilaceae archaeon]